MHGDGFATASQPSGERVPRVGAYELLEEIGRGGCGIVYRARHAESGVLHAVKVIAIADLGDELVRFERECRLLASLDDHPGLVRVHGFGRDGGALYCAMDLVRGASLDRRLHHEGRPRPREAARIARDVARAVDHVHRRGVIHRDIKPGNVVLEPDGRVRVLDFGLALDLRATRVTRTGDLFGTPGFMAPEQVDPKIAGAPVGPATDVYGIGALLYTLLAGAPPFVSESAVALLQQVLTEQPAPLPADVPPGLAGICRQAMSKAPADRHRSAAELADALDRVVEARPARAAEQPARPAPRTRALAAVAGAGVLAGAAAAFAVASAMISARREPAAAAAKAPPIAPAVSAPAQAPTQTAPPRTIPPPIGAADAPPPDAETLAAAHERFAAMIDVAIARAGVVEPPEARARAVAQAREAFDLIVAARDEPPFERIAPALSAITLVGGRFEMAIDELRPDLDATVLALAFLERLGRSPASEWWLQQQLEGVPPRWIIEAGERELARDEAADPGVLIVLARALLALGGHGDRATAEAWARRVAAGADARWRLLGAYDVLAGPRPSSAPADARADELLDRAAEIELLLPESRRWPIIPLRLAWRERARALAALARGDRSRADRALVSAARHAFESSKRHADVQPLREPHRAAGLPESRCLSCEWDLVDLLGEITGTALGDAGPPACCGPSLEGAGGMVDPCIAEGLRLIGESGMEASRLRATLLGHRVEHAVIRHATVADRPLLDRMLPLAEEAVRLIGEAVAEAPNEPWLLGQLTLHRERLAKVRFRLGDAERALADMEGAIAAARAHVAKADPIQHWHHDEVGNRLQTRIRMLELLGRGDEAEADRRDLAEARAAASALRSR